MMKVDNISIKHIPVLDSDFMPAVLWNREYRRLAKENGQAEDIKIAIFRPDGTISVLNTIILPYSNDTTEINNRYIERIIKFLLWQKGGCKILLSNQNAADCISSIYSTNGTRSFDFNFMGDKIYGKKMEIAFCPAGSMPEPKEVSQPLGRNLDGCRIGFDLGGSDRKCAAVIDGKVVHSEEVKWNPYFETDPQYHIDGINDTLKRAAAKMPRVDAVGGSAAGVYVNNQVRVASLFRGLDEDAFNERIRPLFIDLQKEWNVPLDVVNDGEVTALAGSMSLNDNAVLGISMGTSVAAGYVTPDGNITPWLNELAFVPVDYRDRAPVDEWSGDKGCAVQYFCQQGVTRLASQAGLEYPQDMPLAERLVEVQELMAKGDDRAADIFSTIGTCFGYTIAHFADFYEFRHLLFLGRVTSGKGGDIIIGKAEEVLADEFPELKEKIDISVPDEKMKRHGQAIAAASLPSLVNHHEQEGLPATAEKGQAT